MTTERHKLMDSIAEELECLPLSPSVLRSTRDRLEKTSAAVLREIWEHRADWKDAIAHGLMSAPASASPASQSRGRGSSSAPISERRCRPRSRFASA